MIVYGWQYIAARAQTYEHTHTHTPLQTQENPNLIAWTLSMLVSNLRNAFGKRAFIVKLHIIIRYV